MKKINQSGFSLVELLAVIAIISILMGISIPAVSRLVENSRKDAYINIVKLQKNSIEQYLTQQNAFVFDENTVYYFDYRLGNEDEAAKSPFADWDSAYVVVTYNTKEKKNEYYWTGIDKAGWKIDLKKQVSQLKRRDIYNIKGGKVIPGKTVGGRDKVEIHSLNYETGEVEIKEEGLSNEVSYDEAIKCFTIKELGNGTYSIVSYNESCGTTVDVPSRIDGKDVTIIGENAFKDKKLVAVHLYYGIKTIENGAFQNNKITDLKLSPSITTIGPFAFYNNLIPAIDFPEGLETIDTYGFANNKLTEIILPKTLKKIGSYAFYGNLLNDIEFQSNINAGSAAFSNNKMPPSKGIIYQYNATTGQTDYTTIIGYAGSSKDVVIPEMINGVAPTTIASSAFASNQLTSISIPDSVTSIGSSAFYSNKLTQIKLPANLKTIGDSAFRENWLNSINIPPSVTSIGKAAFVRNCVPAGQDIIYARNSDGTVDYSTIVSGAGGRKSGSTCQGNLSLKIPAEKEGVKLKKIETNAFHCSYYTSYELPELSKTNNLTVGDNAFYHNSFSNSQAWIYKISNGSYDYSTLSSYGGSREGDLKIPGSKNGEDLKTIRASFTWTSFTSIEIPDTVTTLSNGIFSRSNTNNVKLTKIINKTGRKFDWYKLTGSSHHNPGEFITGTVSHQSGNVEITDK